MSLRRAAACALLLALAAERAGLALDPRKAITQYVHEKWGTAQGLPMNDVSHIGQTRNGYLWVSTEDGAISRFDGVRFTVFHSSKTPRRLAAVEADHADAVDGVCAALALLDGETGELELASAGIPNPFLVRASGAIERVPLSGAPLGYLRRVSVLSASAALEPGDRLVRLTDGLLEQLNAGGEEWGYAGVDLALSRVAWSASPREVVGALLAACEAHAAGAARSDDRTVVVIARRAS